MSDKKCPFCGAKRVKFCGHVTEQFRCGTVGPNENDEYNTGKDCDLACYRAAVIRMADLLKRATADVIESGDHMTLFVPRTLYDDIRKEVGGG